jgi:hypothetical protein
MDPKSVLPKRLVNYIHDAGVRALDNLSNSVAKDGETGAVQTLVNDWKAMSKEDKERFVDRVAASVIEVIASSALLPVGAKLGKKAAKSVRKAIKRRKKALKESASTKKKQKKKSASAA